LTFESFFNRPGSFFNSLAIWKHGKTEGIMHPTLPTVHK